MRHARSLAVMALVALGLGGAGLSRVAVAHQAADPTPTAPATYTVTAGFGDRNGAANVFAPQIL